MTVTKGKSNCRIFIGEFLWRKFKDVKAIIVNDFSALYASNLTGGQPPSGISYQEILDKTVGAGALIRYKRGDDDVGWFICYRHS